jgi:hypothetical protein
MLARAPRELSGSPTSRPHSGRCARDSTKKQTSEKSYRRVTIVLYNGEDASYNKEQLQAALRLDDDDAAAEAWETRAKRLYGSLGER